MRSTPRRSIHSMNWWISEHIFASNGLYRNLRPIRLHLINQSEGRSYRLMGGIGYENITPVAKVGADDEEVMGIEVVVP